MCLQRWGDGGGGSEEVKNNEGLSLAKSEAENIRTSHL